MTIETTLVIIGILIATCWYGLLISDMFEIIELDAKILESSRMEALELEVKSKICRRFYFPVEVYARIADHLDKKTEERASE